MRTLLALVALASAAPAAGAPRGEEALWRQRRIGHGIAVAGWSAPVAGLGVGMAVMGVRGTCAHRHRIHGCSYVVLGPMVYAGLATPAIVATGATIATDAVIRLGYEPGRIGLGVAWTGVGLLAITLADPRGDGTAEGFSYSLALVGLAMQGLSNFVATRPNHGSPVAVAPMSVEGGAGVQLVLQR